MHPSIVRSHTAPFSLSFSFLVDFSIFAKTNAMDILLKPDSLSLSGNINHFVISSTVEVVFRLKRHGSNIPLVLHSYTPDGTGRIDIDPTDILLPLLKFHLRDVTEIYRQEDLVGRFTAEIEPIDTKQAVIIPFTVLRAGIDHFSDVATNFLRTNFLTWQPNIKPVTYYTPEFLSYYAVEDARVKCTAHLDRKDTPEVKTIELGLLSAGDAWTIPVQYAIMAGKFKENPLFYDIFIEDLSGNRLTYIQRYYPTDLHSEEELWVLFENSLGGIDTFRAYGNATNTAKHTHNIAEIEGIAEEYRVDTEREFKKNTGHLGRRERQWLLDFFPSLAKFIYVGSYIRRIVLTDSDVTYSERETPSGYSFTYKYADAKPFLNLQRTEPLTELSIQVPDVGSFTLAPRLVELPALPLSEGALFPVQSPYSGQWQTTNAQALATYITHAIVNSYKGDGSVGHTHSNINTLNALTQLGRYLLLNAQKVHAGYADQAGQAIALEKESVDWQKILRRDVPDTAEALITFLNGLKTAAGIESTNFDAVGETGFALSRREDGKYRLSIGDLVVWGKAVFNELEKRKLSFVGGNMVFSPAGSKIVKVVPVDAYGYPAADDSTTAAWRCFFFQDDGTTATTNTWEAGDQARCHTSNIKPGVYKNVANKDYWRRVVTVGADFIDLSKDDCSSGSDIPEVGDTIVQMGSRTNPDRQSLIYITISGDDAPAIAWYAGVNGYTLKGKRTAIISPGKVEFSTQFFRLVSGSGTTVPMVADRGRWLPTETYAYYDRVSHAGALWLCVAPSGKVVTSEPKPGNIEWLLQVEKGDPGSAAVELRLDIVRGDLFYREGQGFVAELKATVMQGDTDLTPTLHPSQMVWTRETEDAVGDKEWNARHRAQTDRLSLSTDDLVGSTAIVFTLYRKDGTPSAAHTLSFSG